MMVLLLKNIANYWTIFTRNYLDWSNAKTNPSKLSGSFHVDCSTQALPDFVLQKKKKITDTELIGNALLSTSPVLLSSYIKKFNLHLFLVLLFELRNLDLPLFHNSKHSLFRICGYKGLEWPFLLYEKVYFVENLFSFYLMLNTRKNRVLCQLVLLFCSPKQSNCQMTVSPQFFLPS